jgi:hypothetical protein
MDRELRPKPTLYSVGAFLLAVVLTVASFIILGCALLGCATVKPYAGTELQPTYHEEFVSWEDVDNGLANKRLYVNNPLSHAIKARFQCGTPLDLEVDVPARSTKVVGIFDIIPSRHAEYAPDACRLDGYEVVR